ncbi:hypothetical protein BHK69_00840 [Bosea vaviloviae]|uniref:Uncharacterized protein n=1 Tax=Bosea vaviloviae TaxID=1526658 RepID=A0A1D7TVT8_9HYPH|nr:hypothetical protein BHK69_00840 [Bosea vaviloviae]
MIPRRRAVNIPARRSEHGAYRAQAVLRCKKAAFGRPPSAFATHRHLPPKLISRAQDPFDPQPYPAEP